MQHYFSFSQFGCGSYPRRPAYCGDGDVSTGCDEDGKEKSNREEAAYSGNAEYGPISFLNLVL